MSTLLVGYDSAWTSTNSGALVGVLRLDDGTYHELGNPQIVDFIEAENVILKWQLKKSPVVTLVLLDQPTIVKNESGQRPVENIVGSLVSLRYGGVQPANTSRAGMFGNEAPVWSFLNRFGGSADPLEPVVDTRVFETYPVLAMIALGWTLPDSRATGRLPKYNPDRRKTFSIMDWRFVCESVSNDFRKRGLIVLANWLDAAAQNASPRKRDQDGLDACLCLLVAFYMAEEKDCLMVGDLESGYIVVPHSPVLQAELSRRCFDTGRVPSEWVRAFRCVS